MPSVSKNVMYSLLVQIPAQTFGIIAGIFITRMLGPEGKGLYSIFYADITLFGTMLDLSIVNSIIYFSSTGKISHSKLMALAVLFAGIMLLLGSIIIFSSIFSPFAHYVFPLDNYKWQYASFFLLFLMITHINTLYPAFFQGKKDFKMVNKMLLFYSIITLIVFVNVYLLHRFAVFTVGLREVLILGFSIQIINTIIWHLHFRKKFKYDFNFKISWKEDIKAFTRFMGFGHLTVIVSFLNYRMVLWIMAYFLDEGQVGIYTVAAGVGQILYYVTTPLAQVLMPHMSSESSPIRNSIFKRYSRMHFLFIFILAVAGYFISPYLLPLVYGTDFSASVIPFRIIVFGAVIASQSKIFESYLLSLNKVKLSFYTTLTGFLINTVLCYHLVVNFEVIGAAMSQTITAIISFLLIYMVSMRFTNIDTYNFFLPGKRDLRLGISWFKRRFRK